MSQLYVYGLDKDFVKDDLHANVLTTRDAEDRAKWRRKSRKADPPGCQGCKRNNARMMMDWIKTKQLWTVAGVLLTITVQGMDIGYMSVILVGLRKPDSPVKLDIHLASWLATGMAMSLIVGSLLASIMMHFFGRKKAFLLGLLPEITAWLLIYFGTNFSTLMVARLLSGISASFNVLVGTVVIGECTNPVNRGMFLNLKTTCICLGSTIIHGLGFYYHWKTIALIGLVPNLVSLIMATTWRESPSWLASKKRFEECEEAFLWLRGDSGPARKELKKLIRSQNLKVQQVNCAGRLKTFFMKFTRKDFLKPVFILVLSFVVLEVSGRHILQSYSSDIIGGITGRKAGSFSHTLIVDIIVTLSSGCSSILIKFLRTRTLFFSSGISSLFVLGIACLFLFLADLGVVPNERPWIPVTIFIVYFILINLGCTPIPLALIGEVMPLEHRSSGIFVSSILSCGSIVVLIKAFPYLMLHLHIYGAFLVLWLIMAILLFILYFLMPETNGKTLQEIEECLKNQTYDVDDGNDDESLDTIRLTGKTNVDKN